MEEAKQNVRKIEKAYVLTAELGDRIRSVLMEMPMKFGPMVGPVLEQLDRSPRADVEIKEEIMTAQKPES